jgi:hypothetical protein
MAVGFGEAGSEIISKNMEKGIFSNFRWGRKPHDSRS